MTELNKSFNILYPRSSHRRRSLKKDVLKNYAKFTEKHLCQSLFFNKVTGLRREKFGLLVSRLDHEAVELFHRNKE